MASLRVVLRVPRRDSPAATASVSTTSADEDASDDQQQPHHTRQQGDTKPPKKRKSSYLVRKEAMGDLRHQQQKLLVQLQELQGKARETMDHSSDRRSLPSLLQQNKALHRRVEMNRLAIAGVKSITASVGARLETPPLGDYIHLPRDLLARRRLLQSLKSRKVHDAVRFVLARAESQDLRRRTRQIETFDTDDGDHVVLDWGVAKFSQNGLSVKRVFDEIVEFMHNHEMTLADKLGVIAVRESEVCPDGVDATEVRILIEHGPRRLLVEKNLVIYLQYFEQSELLAEPHGVIVFDYIDQDDLHPYQPLTRIRKDVSSVTMVRQCPRQWVQKEDAPDEIAVVKWAYGRTHMTPLAIEDELQGTAREAGLFDFMVQTVRERLAWKTS